MNYLKSLEIAWNHLKAPWIALDMIFFIFKFFDFFGKYIRMGKSKNSNYKKLNIETKYLNNLR